MPLISWATAIYTWNFLNFFVQKNIFFGVLGIPQNWKVRSNFEKNIFVENTLTIILRPLGGKSDVKWTCDTTYKSVYAKSKIRLTPPPYYDLYGLLHWIFLTLHIINKMQWPPICCKRYETHFKIVLPKKFNFELALTRVVTSLLFFKFLSTQVKLLFFSTV